VSTKTNLKTGITRMSRNLMSVKSDERSSEKTVKTTSIVNAVVVKRRGRPKGAKNKPKIPTSTQEETPAKLSSGRRGRPKGSKNKPKGDTVKVTAPVLNQEHKLEVTKPTTSVGEHPIIEAIKWIAQNMHSTQVDYYRRRAVRHEVSMHYAMASDLIGFFNIQDPQLLKQIKKNNFIV
jgi:hypothetical protein